MISANELRIGNWVNFFDDNTYFRVTVIDEPCNGIGVKSDKEETWIELDKFSPISITPEILEKAGFKKVDYYAGKPYIRVISENHELMWNNGVFTLVCDDSHYNDTLKHIKHLNQLQNLYFALTGTELNIQL